MSGKRGQGPGISEEGKVVTASTPTRFHRKEGRETDLRSGCRAHSICAAMPPCELRPGRACFSSRVCCHLLPDRLSCKSRTRRCIAVSAPLVTNYLSRWTG